MEKKTTKTTTKKQPVKRKTLVKKTPPKKKQLTRKRTSQKKVTIKQSLYDKYPEIKNVVANIALTGDISKLDPNQKVMYYTAYCESLKLNPLTKPFDIIKDKYGKEKLYANKECAAQLRELHQISIDSIHIENDGNIYMVIVNGHDKGGKTDCDVGVVPIAKLKPADLADAIMKATTKAKRRLTLSIAGLGGLDEEEIESIKRMEREEVKPADYSTDNLKYKKDEDLEIKENRKDEKKNTRQKIISLINKHQKVLKEQYNMVGSDIIKKTDNISEEDRIKYLEELEDLCQSK